MDQKVNFKAEKKNYPKDSIIIQQGSSTKGIYFLHQGAVEVKRCSDSINGLKANELACKSKRVAVIESPNIFGILNVINSNIHDSSYIAMSEVMVTKYIIPSDDFTAFFRSNPPIALNVLLTLQEQLTKRLINLKKYSDYIGIIDKFIDNFKLLYCYANDIKKDQLYDKFVKSGGVFPSVIDGSFLKGDYSKILDKSYTESGYDPYEKFDGKKIKFFNHLLKAKSSAFISLMTIDNNIFLYLFDSITSTINALSAETEKFVSSVESKLSYLFLDNTSPFNQIYTGIDKIKKNKNVDQNIAGSVVSICRNIDMINKQLGGREHIEAFPKYDILNSKSGGQQQSGNNAFSNQPGQFVTGNEPPGKYQILFANSAKKILDYSTLTLDEKDRVLKNISKIKKLNFEDITSGDNRKIIRNLQIDYFELYQNIFLKAIKEKAAIPPVIQLFIYFSFIDEKLLSEKQVEFLYNSLAYLNTDQNTAYPIITLFDYLKLIYNKEEEPSLSERGEFRKVVNKNFGKANKIVEDTPLGRLEFEIVNMASNGMRIISDNMRAFIPYLMDRSFRGPFSNLFVNPKKLDMIIKKIADVDYTLFFRELTWKIPGKSELIQKEIMPYLIITPGSGIRVQMWQEMVYSIRSSRARFLIPVMFNGDLEKNLTFACGHFRWNLNKAIVSNWMDPVDGGLTGAYYDYEQSYKKMPDLSEEVKDKIKKQIKTIKIDRNRFATEYFEWVMYESQGVPKLNKIVRKIFYRYVPFKKEIRSTISKLPVYSELDRKFDIIRDRDFKKIEAKFKKYKEGENLPEDLQAFLDMMQK